MSELALHQARVQSLTAAMAATTSTRLKAAWKTDLDATNARIAELSVVPTPAPAPAPAPAPVATPLGFTLGVNIGNDGGDPAAGSGIEANIDAYATWIGPRLTIAHQFADPNFIGTGEFYWGGAWTDAMLARWGAWKAEKPGRRMMFTIAPGYASANIGMQANGHAVTDETGFNKVISGAEDASLRSMGELLDQYGLGDSILRVFHEPPWYCWGVEGAHGGQPYRDAIHHISTVVKAVAPNLVIAPSWDMGLNGRHDHLDDSAGYDAICVDYYCGDGNLPAIKADAAKLAMFAASVGKPVVVAEWGLWHPTRVSDTDAVGFFQFMVGWAKTLGVPLVYFEDNPPEADRDHRLWTGTPYDPTVVNGFLAAVRS